MPLFSASQLEEIGRVIFRAVGTPEDLAERVARSLARNNQMGHDSHGVIRIPGYIQEIENGSMVADARPVIEKETASTALVNGNWAFGLVSAQFATEVAIEKARKSQVAAVSINRCNHIGRVGGYTEMAAAEGMAAFVLCGIVTSNGSPGAVAPFGGAERVLGTNPISMAVPAREGEPVVLDYATSVAAEGKVRVARAKNEPLPPGEILDKDGNPSTDANDFYNGGVLLPFGGHKGYALSVMADLLGGYLSSSDVFPNGLEAFGTLIVVLNVEAFRPLAEFREAVSGRLQKIKSVRPAPGFSEVMLPGEPERRTLLRRAKEGINLPEDTYSKLQDTAAKLGVELPA
ncbi:MAG TPA: Ldh family oxidoreductase [Chloroflexota bacterium]|nr:Ldh family oxidoreductase [Chloroflexota bacterium]